MTEDDLRNLIINFSFIAFMYIEFIDPINERKRKIRQQHKKDKEFKDIMIEQAKQESILK